MMKVANDRRMGIGPLLALWLVLSVAFGGAVWGLWTAGLLGMTATSFAMTVVRAAVVMLFLVFGWHEIAMLFRRPAKNMGTGWNRVWSVGRTTVYEAWAGRVWLLPILWLVASFVMISAIRPYDESERMPLNIRTLLSSQELLLLVMMLVMACISLPRERERKIIITNASKPLSRLEIVLGKMVGFSLVAALMVGVMGVASWGILHWSNWKIKRDAAQSYELQQKDYNQKLAAGARDEAVRPSEGTKRLQEEGSLFAYNYVPATRENLSVVGFVDLTKNPPMRMMKGGSQENAGYRFARLPVPRETLVFPAGRRGYFEFYFPYQSYTGEAVKRVQIRVKAMRIDPRQSAPPTPVEKVVTLNERGEGAWEPDPEQSQLFSGADTGTGEITEDAGAVGVEVQCITPGVLVQVLDGASPDPKTGQVAEDVPWNVIFRPVRDTPLAVYPEPNPTMRGFERRGKQEIDGPKRSDVMVGGGVLVEQGVWRFPGADLALVKPDAEGNFEVAFLLDTYKTDNIDAPTQAHIRIKSYDSLAEKAFETNVQVAEKRLMTVKVPKQFLGNPDAKQRGDMVVLLSCVTPDHSISMDEKGCRIELAQTPFWFNLFKSEMVILLEAMLLIGIAVTFSVRLGWPVAMLVTVACTLFGVFAEFVVGLQEGGGLLAFNYRPSQIVNGGVTIHFFDAAATLLWKVLGVFATLVPDFTIYRVQDQYITNLQNMPIEVLLGNVLWTGLFLAPFVGLAYLMFRKQELG